jgi:parvulin-like peptidyl-prolyl isomerase
MTQYGQPLPATDEEIAEWMTYVKDGLFSNYSMLWKADENDLVLTDEEKAEVEAEVANSREDYISSYTEEARTSHANDEVQPSEDALRTEALNSIEEEVMYYVHVDFDTYMNQYRDQLLNQALINKLHDFIGKDVTITDEEVEAYYNELIGTYKTTYAETPLSYKTDTISFETEAVAYAPLWIPEGFANVSVITISPEGALPEDYEGNKTKMSTLAAEYGTLVLNGEDETRQAAIKEEYATLKAAVDAAYNLYANGAKAKADEAFAAATAGEDFTVLMGKYNAGEKADKRLVYLTEADSDFDPALWTAISNLEEGQISNTIEINGVFYILKLENKIKSETVAFSTVSEVLRTETLAKKTEEVWTQLQDGWMTEAMNATTIHEDAIAWIGKA